MKEGWEYKKLGAVADFYRGLTYKREDEVDSSDNCVLRSNNIDLDSMSLNFDELKYIRPDFVIPEDKKLKANSVFVCMSNGSKQHVGKVAYVNEDMNYAFGGFMGLIVPKPQAMGKYIYYVCRSSFYRHFLEQIGNGIGIMNLRFTDLNEFSIPFPTLSEQQHIVEELDLLSSIIEKKKAQLNELDNLAQSLFYEMFGDPIINEKGWEVKKLGKLCITSSGGTPSKTHKEYYEGGNIPWLRSGEVAQGYIYNTEMYITEEGLNNSSAKYFPINTVVVAMYGATVGQVGILKSRMTTNQAICGIFPSESFVPTFLMFFLKGMKPVYLKDAAGGAQPNISQGVIKNTLVPIVSIALQQQFVERIETIEHQKELIKQSIKEVETLFNSRMDYYFN